MTSHAVVTSGLRTVLRFLDPGYMEIERLFWSPVLASAVFGPTYLAPDSGTFLRLKVHPKESIPATDRGDDGNEGWIGHERRQSARVADILVAYKDIDVLADLALFVHDAIADSRTGSPKRRQCVGDSSA